MEAVLPPMEHLAISIHLDSHGGGAEVGEDTVVTRVEVSCQAVCDVQDRPSPHERLSGLE